MMEWINIEDSKPEDGKSVLLFDVFRNIKFGFYEKNNDLFRSLLDDSKVNATHWMPLPEPPVL